MLDKIFTINEYIFMVLCNSKNSRIILIVHKGQKNYRIPE